MICVCDRVLSLHGQHVYPEELNSPRGLKYVDLTIPTTSLFSMQPLPVRATMSTHSRFTQAPPFPPRSILSLLSYHSLKLERQASDSPSLSTSCPLSIHLKVCYFSSSLVDDHAFSIVANKPIFWL